MSKKHKKAKELVKKDEYKLEEALELLPKLSTSKFVGSIELTINFKLNDKQKKEGLRASVIFPNSFGEGKKVLVFTEKAKEKEAKDAGADFVGLEDFMKKIEGGWSEFDVAIATPSVMPQIAKLGKYLGQKGLMPNPKNQTVTNDLAKTVKMYKGGKKDFKMNEQGSIKLSFGKVDMTKEALTQNFQAFFKAISADLQKLRMESIKNIFLSPTMGPSLKLENSEIGLILDKE